MSKSLDNMASHAERNATMFTDLPNEVLLAIITIVDFSPDTMLSMSLINKRVQQLMVDSKQLLFNAIAELQFPEANCLRGDEGDHSIASLKKLKEDTEAVRDILNFLPQDTPLPKMICLSHGLHIIQRLADMELAQYAHISWTICSSILTWNIIALIRYTTTHLARYLTHAVRSTGVSTYDFKAVQLETMLLTSGIGSLTRLYGTVATINSAATIDKVWIDFINIRDFEMFPGDKASVPWVDILYGLLDSSQQVAAVLGRMHTTAPRRLSSVEVFTNALIMGIVTDHTELCPSSVRTHLQSFQTATERLAASLDGSLLDRRTVSSLTEANAYPWDSLPTALVDWAMCTMMRMTGLSRKILSDAARGLNMFAQFDQSDYIRQHELERASGSRGGNTTYIAILRRMRLEAVAASNTDA
jgi:hypothetical protein